MKLKRNQICAMSFAVFALPKVCFGLTSSDSEILISHLRIIDRDIERFAANSREVNKSDTENDHQVANVQEILSDQEGSNIILVSQKDAGDAMVPTGDPSSTTEVPKGTDDVMVQSGEDKVSLLPEDAEALEEDDNIFGLKRGFFHPMISLHVAYTDNLYNLDETRESNVLTQFNAGLWISVPRRDEEPLALATHNPSGSGIQYMLEDYESADRWELYLKGNLHYKMYSIDEELNNLAYSAEGVARYNFPGGLKLQLVDQFVLTEDRYEVGNPDSNLTHTYYSNVVVATADWDITEKFRIKGDVSLFFLRYDEDEFDYLERDDIFLSLYGYFNWTEKTSIFLEYSYGVIGYDSSTDYDSEQHLLYAGMRWDTTEKTSFYAKVGFQDKRYTSDGSDFIDQFGLALEAQVRYRYTEKTLFQLSLYKKNEETDSQDAQDKNVWGATFNYDQEYTEKLHGTMRVRFEYADYTEIRGEERDEWRLVLQPKIRYAFRDWLNVELGYQYDMRESTDDRYNYYSNTIFVNLNLHL